jgi:hypothetical protein
MPHYLGHEERFYHADRTKAILENALVQSSLIRTFLDCRASQAIYRLTMIGFATPRVVSIVSLIEY